jgi:hypothetical protein
LRAVPVDGKILAFQRLDDEVGDHPSIIGEHPGTVGVKDSYHANIDSIFAMIIEE